MNADAQLNLDVTATPCHCHAVHRRPDVDRHVGYLGHVTVAITLRHTADDHVDATDGFHLQQQQQQQRRLLVSYVILPSEQKGAYQVTVSRNWACTILRPKRSNITED